MTTSSNSTLSNRTGAKRRIMRNSFQPTFCLAQAPQAQAPQRSYAPTLRLLVDMPEATRRLSAPLVNALARHSPTVAGGIGGLR